MCDKRVCACRKKSDSGVVRKVLEDEVKRLEKDYERFMKTDGSSMLKKYLTPYRFDKLKTLKTFHGSTLRDVIRSGLANPDSNIGIYAPDPEAYDIFSSLYDPVIEEYHRGFAADDVHPDLDWGKPEDIGDLDEERKYINSTRIRCARSIHGYPFNPTMTESQYLEVERKVSARYVAQELTGAYDILDYWL